MSSKISMMKSIVVTAALVAGVSGIAGADDSSMNPFTGDSYAYFNGRQSGKPVFDNLASSWRQSHPNGQSESQLQALSSEASAYNLKAPVFANAPLSWRQSHPNGLSKRQFQALSSEAPAWQLPNQSQPSALALTHGAPFVQSAAK